jgi:hypothetical protein
MERPKKLEFPSADLDISASQSLAKPSNVTDTQLSTHGTSGLAEIVSAWPSLGPDVQDSVLTLVLVANSPRRDGSNLSSSPIVIGTQSTAV